MFITALGSVSTDHFFFPNQLLFLGESRLGVEVLDKLDMRPATSSESDDLGLARSFSSNEGGKHDPTRTNRVAKFSMGLTQFRCSHLRLYDIIFLTRTSAPPMIMLSTTTRALLTFLSSKNLLLNSPHSSSS